MKSLLKDKNVLRVVALLSVLNLIGYLMTRNLDAVAFFAIVGFLTTYFSKNMIVVLLVAMVLTNFFAMGRKTGNMLEGMKSSRKTTAGMKKNVKAASAEIDNEEGTGRVGELDHAATVEAAHENLANFLDNDGISAMANKTEALTGLMDKQEKLMANVQNLGPVMEKMEGMINKMGGMDKIMGYLGQGK